MIRQAIFKVSLGRGRKSLWCARYFHPNSSRVPEDNHTSSMSYPDKEIIYEENNKSDRRYESSQRNHYSSKSQDGNSNENHYKSRGSSFRDSPTTAATAIAAASTIIFRKSFDFDDMGPEPPNNNKNSHLIEDLHQAVLAGDERRVDILIKKCTPNDVNSRHKLGWQMLHLAAVNGRSRICELLLQGGARVNDIDHYSSPRLMSEKYNIDPMVVALLRDTEFNPDLARVNFYGCTALHYAALSNSEETVKLLLKQGANPTLKNELGFTPAQFANPTIAQTIMAHEEVFRKREQELEEEERLKYPLEERIKKHIVGQEAAISTVAATIRRKQNGWCDNDHPLVFLFLGSSGIGKTELAKQVSKYLHKDNKKGFIRLDMSEYQEQHSVSRMIGSPPGYVGYQEGGQLTEALKECNNAVVLFDEVEKAHPKVLTVLLQLFDEGRLTDGKGKTIVCKDAIFIMTSNLASDAIAEHAVQLRNEQKLLREIRIENRFRDFNLKDESKPTPRADEKNKETVESDDYQEQITISRKFKDTIVRPVLKSHFQRNEFLGRINEMVYFLPFSQSELRQLVVKELEFWAERAKNNSSIEMTWDDKVIDVICKGYDIHYGARSIKHEVDRRIINQISELHHTMKKAKKVHISVNDKTNDGADLIKIKIS